MFLSSQPFHFNNFYSASQSFKGTFYDVNTLRKFLSIVILTVKFAAVKLISSIINVILLHFCSIHPHSILLQLQWNAWKASLQNDYILGYVSSALSQFNFDKTIKQKLFESLLVQRNAVASIRK